MATARKLRHRKGLHVEAEGCIVNIYENLQDNKGQNVTHIEIIPDDHYAGERIWKVIGSKHIRVIQLQRRK